MKLGDTGDNVRSWQTLLNQQGYKVRADGNFGVSTDAATRKFQLSKGLKPDGVVGEKTMNAALSQSVTINKGWPKQDYNSMVNFYGPVGENQTSLELPYQVKLAWDLNTKLTKITCHAKVAVSLYSILEQTLKAYGLSDVQKLRLDVFGGCLNVRKMRGGSSWSIHSWGAAIDLDPDNNQLKWTDSKASFAKPEYNQFWKIVENEGWISLGRRKNYDWMHFQAADIN